MYFAGKSFRIILGLGCLAAFSAVAGELTIEQVRTMRYDAAHKPRRMIFNNDGGDATVQAKAPTPEAVLEARTTALANTHVDSIFYSTSRGTFGSFTHKTEVGETFVSKEGRFSTNVTGDLIAQGTDPLQVMIDFARTHDMEIVWSMRMNDTHDSWGYEWEDITTSQLKKDHPEWLVGSKENKPPHGGFKAADYTHPEIREYAFGYIEEVCNNYDIDGAEMDFFRHPVFFKRHAWGEDVTQEERDMMTNLMRRVRIMMDERGAERGKPILLAVRVPDSAAYCRAIGLDIEEWLEEGLIDLMTVSGYFRLNPWKTSVELGHRHGVPVYPCLSETRFREEEARPIRASAESYRGRALNAWAQGVDGIYMFNLFNPKSELWRQLGEPAVIKKHDRLYTTGARHAGVLNRWLANGERFLNREFVSPSDPHKIEPGESVPVPLMVGEALSETQPKAAQLELRFEEAPEPDTITVTVNGTALDVLQPDGAWLKGPVPYDAVKMGENAIEVSLSESAKAPVVWNDLVLRIDQE